MQNKPAIILVTPQMGENIGAAARAMANFGLTDLRLINPRDGWPNELAIRNGSGAFDHVKTQIFENFEGAIADLQTVYATTARPRDLNKRVYNPAQAIEKSAGKTGIVFGAERTGLLNEHIAQCNAVITFETNPDFSSLNLGQAVLLVASQMQNNSNQEQHLDFAQQSEIKNLSDRLIQELETAQFFREDNLRPKIEENIRNLLSRAHLSESETKMLHGIITALTKQKAD